MVSSYLVKYDSEPFCEGMDTFWKRLTFKSVDFESSRLCSVVWVGLIQSVKGLENKTTDPTPSKGNFAADVFRFELQALTFF